MKTNAYLLTATLATAVLTACGGSSSDPVDKYVGTWYQAEAVCANHGVNTVPVSIKSTIAITKSNATTMVGTINSKTYTQLDCQGTETPSPDDGKTYSFTLKGTKVIEGQTTDIAYVPDQTNSPGVMFINASEQFCMVSAIATQDHPLDAAGLPTTLSTAVCSKRV